MTGLALAVVTATAAAAESIEVPVEMSAGPRPATLSARLHTPAGRPPFPTVVFLHGCGGLGPAQNAWTDALVADGYAVLVLDSFGARGIGRVCGGQPRFAPLERAADVFAALRALRSRPEVDGECVGIIGWSHGGSTALWALAQQGEHPAERVRAAIALYPGCADSRGWKDAAPLLMLLGERDDWTPAERCLRAADVARGFGQRVETVVYPGAGHAFDNEVLRRPVRVRDALGGKGATIAYNPAAHQDARRQVRAFLARHLAVGR